MSWGVLGVTEVCVGGALAVRGEVLCVCKLCGIEVGVWGVWVGGV